jgi:hypothetical protein
VAKIYNLNRLKDLKQLNIFYKSILGVFEYEEQYAVLIDESHLCFVPNEEEVKRLVKNINLNIANKCIENSVQNNNAFPKVNYSDSEEYEKAIVQAFNKEYECNIVSPKDLRIDGIAMVSNKRLMKQFYAKALKKGKKYEALDFNFEELDSKLINDIATLVLGIYRPNSSEIATLKNYKENYEEAITDFLEYSENKNKILKKYDIDNSLVDTILQTEKAFKELKPLRKAIVLHKSGEGIMKPLEENSSIKYTSFISTSLVEKEENYQNSIYYHFVVPKGTPFALINQIEDDDNSTNEVLLPPASFEIKSIENENNRRTNIKLKFEEQLEISEILLEAFRENCKNYVKVNSNLKKSRDQYEKNKYKYPKFYATYSDSEQLDLFKEVNNLIENRKISYVLEEIEDIDYDKELFLQEGDHGITHTKRAMLIASIFALRSGLTDQDAKILIAAAKYHDIGVKSDETDKEHGRISIEKINHELDSFSENDTELIKFLILEHSLDKKDNEKDIENLPATKREKFKKMLSYFKDIDELEKVRLYDLNPQNLENESAKYMVKLAFINWNVFDTLFSYLLAENFAQSRLQDILTHEKLEQQEQEKKKAFALIRVEDKNTLLSKAIKIFDKIRGGSKEDAVQEENSAAAAKARLAKVMVGRQIAKAEQNLDNKNVRETSTIETVENVIQTTARAIDSISKENQANGI